MPDIKPELTSNREHWKYPVVPEVRIDQECIKAVAKQMGLTELWIQRCHDFQFKLVYDYLEQGKTVYMPRFFKVIMRVDTIKTLIKSAEKRKLTVQERLTKTEEKIKEAESLSYKEMRPVRKGTLSKKHLSIIQELQDIDDKIAHYTNLLHTRTSWAGIAQHKKAKVKKTSNNNNQSI